MGNTLRPPLPPNTIDWRYFEDQFKRGGAEPYPTYHLIGPLALNECIGNLEARLERGEALSFREEELLRQAGEDLVGEDYI